MNQNIFMGIDGGGTKTDIAIVSDSGKAIAKKSFAGSNPNDSGLDNACQSLQNYIKDILSGSELSETDITACFAGISGASTGRNLIKLNDFLHIVLPQTLLKIGSDAHNCISCGIYHNNGCCMIAGTGSSAFARKGEKLFQCGGWGYLVDDAGSGFSIGRDGLCAAFRARDGRGEKTVLAKLLDERYGAPFSMKLDEFYKGGKSAVAAVAPIVFMARSLGDTVAVAIIDKAVDEIKLHISVLKSYFPDEECRVVLCGGMFRDKDVIPVMLQKLIGEGIELINPIAPPVFGAVAEAMNITGIKAGKREEEAFMNSISI
ncbi:N-acetylmuramic acid/N-acetylglucosamine kinase [bioreactor metagenome]|uniref:N-acetylmuramic acid/N-acetylglucosamine kinase n=1 Tax=bioreactor metagenome TaxID=1076179 RepID=A0A645BK09_9ZZZZ|nr:BadF/BadG/BcrA/BcrD ATPase family protein [Oscillospiraceae bacterium]